MLQTDRADISTKLETQQIADLPMGTNRNFQSLLNLVPGAAPQVFQHSQFFNAQSSLQTEANGMPRVGNLYQIEGIDDDERTGLLQIIIPPLEAIQSVDISTNNFEAELGRAIGCCHQRDSQVGHERVPWVGLRVYPEQCRQRPLLLWRPARPSVVQLLSAAPSVGRSSRTSCSSLVITLGPRTMKKSRTPLTIPDPRYYTPNAQGNIDLSAALTGGGGQIYDPATGDGNGTGPGHQRTPFPNNQIPFSRVNPISLAILKGVNAAALTNGILNPNAPLSSPSNNYTTNLPFTKGTNSFDIKVDWGINERNHLSGRYSWQKVNTFQAPAFGSFFGGPAGGGGFEANGDQTSYSTGVNYDHIFSPSFFTEARVGVAHLRNNATPIDYGSNDAATLGVPGVNIAGQPFTSGQIGVTLNGGFSGTLIGYSASVPWIRGESNIDFVNNWTKIVRNHTVKFGADLRRVRDDLLQDQTFSPRGVFTFQDRRRRSPSQSTNSEQCRELPP